MIVTAGPCREPIDPVRFISNRSSGKMGYAIAESARELGAEVTLVSGPSWLKDPFGINTLRVETTEEMFETVREHYEECDILIMAAAPADYKPEVPSGTKIKKNTANLSLSLEPTIDILKALQENKKRGRIVVGFALETDHALENAEKKLKAKGLDLVVLNSMEKGTPFDSDSNEVILLHRDGSKEEISRMDKKSLAVQLMQKLAGIYHDQLER